MKQNPIPAVGDIIEKADFENLVDFGPTTVVGGKGQYFAGDNVRVSVAKHFDAQHGTEPFYVVTDVKSVESEISPKLGHFSGDYNLHSGTREQTSEELTLAAIREEERHEKYPME